MDKYKSERAANSVASELIRRIHDRRTRIEAELSVVIYRS